MAKKAAAKKTGKKSVASKVKKKKIPRAVKTKAPKIQAANAKAFLLKVGDPAPYFKLLTDEGTSLSLSDLKGKRVVLYFYPKDDTPGCTKEACSFRDGIAQVKKQNAVILGVSADAVESHQKFKKKYGLNFSLLSDAEKKMVQAYGVWKQKSMYGKTYMGIERTTFIINEEGKITHLFPQVKVDGHLDEVMSALRISNGELDLVFG